MKSGFFGADTADATAIAVINSLFDAFVTVEAADWTKVFGEIFVTRDASLSFILNLTAPETLHMLHRMSI